MVLQREMVVIEQIEVAVSILFGAGGPRIYGGK